jgi:site-specific recombinase XerD
MAVAVLVPTTGELAEGRAEELAVAWLLGYGNKRTRTEYRRDLGEWGRWLSHLGLEPMGARRAHVEAFARSQELAGRSRSTVARKLAALASFYAYAVDEGAVDRSPAARARRPRTDADSQQLGLDRSELRAFLGAARASGPRDAALGLLLALNGLRISEAIAADVEHLSTARGHRTLAIVRKGGKRALAPLSPATADAIDNLVEGRSTGPIFTTRTGRRMCRQEAAKIVKRLARQAGISKPVSPHTLRHAFVTSALDAGASLRDVQDAAGHADPRTTRRYDRGRHSLDRHPTYAVTAALTD